MEAKEQVHPVKMPVNLFCKSEFVCARPNPLFTQVPLRLVDVNDEAVVFVFVYKFSRDW